jgi:hypothetical protein
LQIRGKKKQNSNRINTQMQAFLSLQSQLLSSNPLGLAASSLNSLLQQPPPSPWFTFDLSSTHDAAKIIHIKQMLGGVEWYMPAIPALGRLRQED